MFVILRNYDSDLCLFNNGLGLFNV